MYLGTLFLRNRPMLDLMTRIAGEADVGGPLKIAVLGCSIGAEVYSIAWTLRRALPRLELQIHAIDIAPDVVEVGRRGIYSSGHSDMVNASIFDALTDDERHDMFDWQGKQATIQSWLRDGITWEVGDAGNPKLFGMLGPQDVVVANNFLCHMAPSAATRCLRSVSGLVRPGGHLIVSGVDLNVRSRVAFELGWHPVPELRHEIHDGDRLVRSDWPWRWWGLEPLDRSRPDWETRYTAVFRVRSERPPGSSQNYPASAVTPAPA